MKKQMMMLVGVAASGLVAIALMSARNEIGIEAMPSARDNLDRHTMFASACAALSCADSSASRTERSNIAARSWSEPACDS